MAEVNTIIVGAGIVGLAVARELLLRRPGRGVTVLEAEPREAAHQTGHNSGVIHSGLYYKPGSLKALNCARGRELMYAYCTEHGIAHERCGKLVVATTVAQLPMLDELERRGRANGLQQLRRLGPEGLREFEPHATGVAALWVGETGIVDYRAVAKAMRNEVERLGGRVHVSTRLMQVRQREANGDARFTLITNAVEFECGQLINCAGLHSDRVARLCGLEPKVRIVPFRGEYYQLTDDGAGLVRNLIYPVPDPRYPFLGVHFTRMIGGGVEAGPNAVLSLAREGYQLRVPPWPDVRDLMSWPGFWKMARQHAATGLAELRRSLSKLRFARALQELVPEIEARHLVRGDSGVRAQAVDRSGRLMDDFVFERAPGQLHVLNAPSPAATASLAIAQRIVGEMGG